MKNQKSISMLVFVITLLSIIATSYAIFPNQGAGEYEYKSIFGETVSIYGKGLYKHDSVSMAAQAIAQDYVTLFFGVPLLVFSLYLSRKGLLKGHLLLTGTLGYFLYTYASYSFLSMYNSMFLVYVILMAASFFAFTLAMMSFEIAKLPLSFKEKLPVKIIGGFLLFASFVFGMMWLGKIVKPLMNHTPTEGIEHYTTLVIQALDLGFVVPVGIISGILLIKRKPFGYLLASVIIIKDITLLTALSAMIFLQIQAGVEVSSAVVVLILLLNIVVIYLMYLILKNITEESGNSCNRTNLKNF
ncbi:hypothetical protein J7E79_08155 [Bacillus sp. ISL-40]|uniref:hypothetical protein n=1 Tax=unclassified Bacillus (in: firmicutes) TaxID=185979 RepID=UPI001BE7922C|nr:MULTISPECIES: hypothetical protein [unclassified Bacillus (in: firmicutes)]MBT2697383.1 hypothetical protein [Bacillus sp. ISL-40]MBT2723883.1 hypothetical protein [Bacillus sp. ISL-46]MBT2741799.1 hypothetical protein [Bacillus sp. ISL-77]